MKGKALPVGWWREWLTSGCSVPLWPVCGWRERFIKGLDVCGWRERLHSGWSFPLWLVYESEGGDLPLGCVCMGEGRGLSETSRSLGAIYGWRRGLSEAAAVYGWQKLIILPLRWCAIELWVITKCFSLLPRFDPFCNFHIYFIHDNFWLIWSRLN